MCHCSTVLTTSERQSTPIFNYPRVVDSIIAKIEAKFGKMTVTRNRQEDHNFLGIKVKINKALKTVEIDMKQYLLNALGLFLEDYGNSLHALCQGVANPHEHRKVCFWPASLRFG